MNDHKSEVEKKGEQPVNTKKVKKNASRKTTKLKPGRRPDTASERMAFRVTPVEKLELQRLAIEANRTDSNYIRDVMLKHMASSAPPKE
jgi:hypothetical protein